MSHREYMNKAVEKGIKIIRLNHPKKYTAYKIYRVGLDYFSPSLYSKEYEKLEQEAIEKSFYAALNYLKTGEVPEWYNILDL